MSIRTLVEAQRERVCDRCGRTRPYGTYADGPLWGTARVALDSEPPGVNLDLCELCMALIRAALRGARVITGHEK